jgi:hypothetical protein
MVCLACGFKLFIVHISLWIPLTSACIKACAYIHTQQLVEFPAVAQETIYPRETIHGMNSAQRPFRVAVTFILRHERLSRVQILT